MFWCLPPSKHEVYIRIDWFIDNPQNVSIQLHIVVAAHLKNVDRNFKWKGNKTIIYK